VALRTLAKTLPPGTPVPVPAEQLLELLRDAGIEGQAVAAAPAPPPDEPLLTAREAAARLRVPVGYLYRHPRLPFLVRVGRKVRVNPSRLARYLERGLDRGTAR
jgi:excisionase family DNA binding protein